MSEHDISKEAHRIVELMQSDPTGSFLKELQKDQKNMTPKQFAELVHDMAAETKDNRALANFPKVTFHEDAQHNITSVEASRQVLGDKTEAATLDKDGHTTDKKKDVGMVDVSSGVLGPWWSTAAQHTLAAVIDEAKKLISGETSG